MTETRKSSPLLILAAWAVVTIPAGWGLRYTVENAIKLFHQPATAAAQGQAPGPGTPASAATAPK